MVETVKISMEEFLAMTQQNRILINENVKLKKTLTKITKRLLRIGELAERLGVSTTSLRRWESQGLLPPAQRTTAGWRGYDEEDIKHAIEILDKYEPKRTLGRRIEGGK